MTELAQPLDINALNHVNIVEEIIKLSVRWNTKVIAGTHSTEDASAHRDYERLVQHQFPCTREVAAIQLPTEAIDAGKNNFTYGLQIDSLFV